MTNLESQGIALFRLHCSSCCLCILSTFCTSQNGLDQSPFLNPHLLLELPCRKADNVCQLHGAHSAQDSEGQSVFCMGVWSFGNSRLFQCQNYFPTQITSGQPRSSISHVTDIKPCTIKRWCRNRLLRNSLCGTGRVKNFLLKVRKRAQSCTQPSAGLSEQPREEKGEAGTRMAENVLYADLNLPESTRPRILTVSDVQGRSSAEHWAFFAFFSLSPPYVERLPWSTKVPKSTRETWGPMLGKCAGGVSR